MKDPYEMHENTRRLLELHEGRRSAMYYCTAGAPTVGIGHNLRDNVMSDRAIDVLLTDDVAAVARDLDKVFPWWRDEDEVRQAAMVDLCFNLGITRFSKFHNTLNAWHAHVYEAAALGLENSKWYHQVGNRAKRIVDMVRTGAWPKEIA